MNFSSDTTELLFYLMRFLLGSTILLGGVWLAEKTQLIQARDLREIAWKSAILASFLLLLPTTGHWAPTVTVNLPSKVATPADISPPPQSHSTATNQPTAKTDTTSESNTRPISLQPENFASVSWQIPAPLLIVGVIALLIAIALAFTYTMAIRSLGARTRISAEHQAFILLYDICDKAGIKATPYLTLSKRINSPLCLPSGEICLPQWALENIDRLELRSLLAHEVAHLKHHDPIKLLVLHALTRLFFLQPLFVIAQKRLAELAEFAADEWAADQATNPKSVASALYTCAQQISHQKQPQWGLAMARNKSELRARIERLLDANQNEFITTSAWTKRTLMAAMLTSVLAVPALAVGDRSGKDNVSVRHHQDNGTENYRRSINGHEKSISVKGDFALADDGLHIGRLSPGGYFEVSEKGGSNGDRFYRVSDNSGTLAMTFKREGSITQMTEADEQWLAAMMLDYHRNNGRTAKQRIEHLEQQGGLNAVFAEMEQVGKHAIRFYASVLLKSYDLTDRQQLTLLEQIARNESSYELRVALQDWLLKTDLSDAVEQAAHGQMQRIESNYEMRMLLTAQLEQSQLDEHALERFLNLSKSINSNYEMRRLITTALTTQSSNPNGVKPFVKLAKQRISSDYEMRQLVATMTEVLKDSPDSTEIVIGSLKAIKSDYEMRQAVAHIIGNIELEQYQWLDLIAALSQMHSDHEMTKTLINILNTMPQDSVLLDAIHDTMKNHISSRDSLRKLKQALADAS